MKLYDVRVFKHRVVDNLSLDISVYLVAFTGYELDSDLLSGRDVVASPDTPVCAGAQVLVCKELLLPLGAS